MAASTTMTTGAGELLRSWRQRRRLTQLELSLRADVSARHLSFVETGRAVPSREMVLHLAEHLDVPVRERNTLLVAAGYAPVHSEHRLDAPQLQAVRAALDRLLAAHEPYPAVVLDRWWDLVAGNASIALLVEGAAPQLLEPPINVVRLSLHPEGLAPRIRNLGQWRSHLLHRLQGQVEHTGDERVRTLLEEVRGYGAVPRPAPGPPEIVVPLRMTSSVGDLDLISTVATFGTALDATVADLSIEAFYPADEATRRRLVSAAEAGRAEGPADTGPVGVAGNGDPTPMLVLRVGVIDE
jgi:transcriptional regulator with XRE-family HTH domain